MTPDDEHEVAEERADASPATHLDDRQPVAAPADEGPSQPGFASSVESASPQPAATPVPAEAALDGGTMLYCTTAALLAWLVPGGGHAYVGEWRRATLFGLLLVSLFVGGLALDGKIYRIEEDDVLSYAASLGASGLGGPYVLGHALGYGEGDDRAEFHEYGSTFTLVAGLLNLLVILDAFDHALLRRKRALEPQITETDE